MTALKCGDRVKVFTGREEFKGKISGWDPKFPNAFFVIEDGFYSAHNDCPFHPKQLRRLKQKPKDESKPREWCGHWELNSDGFICFYPSRNGGGLIDTHMTLIEKPPGSAVVTRESLANTIYKEIGQRCTLPHNAKEAIAYDVCSLVGLPSPEGKGGKG